MGKAEIIKFYWLRFFLSAIFIAIFVLVFKYNTDYIALHLLTVLFFIFLELLIVKLITVLDIPKWVKGLMPMIPATFLSLLIFLYLIDTIFNNLWGQNINLVYILYVLKDINSLKADTGFSIFEISAIFVSIFIFLFSMIYLSVDFSTVKLKNIYNDKRRNILFVIFTLLLIVGFVFNPDNFVMAKYFREEPILAFLNKVFKSDKRVTGLLYYQKVDYFNKIDAKKIDKKNIVIIFVDSARAINLPMYGYYRDTMPFLNKLYLEGKLAKINYAFSNCPESLCGALSVFSSRDYGRLSLNNTRDSELLLQEILKKMGYKNYFLGSLKATYNSWQESLGKSYNYDFDIVIDQNVENTNNENKETNDDSEIFSALNKISEKGNDPAFFTFWLMSAHVKGKKEKKFEIFIPTESELNMAYYVARQTDEEIIKNRYDNGLVQADYYISKIFEVLGKKGYLKSSLIFIVGDHGESIGERGTYGHLHNLYNEEIRIPMLIYSSDKIDIKNTEYATQEDLAPTILDLLNVKKPDWWQGYSLIDSVERFESIHEVANNVSGEKVILIKKNEKFYKYFYINDNDIYFDKNSDQKLYELYLDPKEENNIIDSVDPALKEEIIQEFIKKFDMKN